MPQEFEVTAEELVRTLQRRGIPLPSEIGAFVVLEACEKLLTRPTLITTRDIFITESGDVECEEPKRANNEAEAVSALLSVLAELLVCAAPGVPNMLLDLVEHGPNEERLSLALLRSDLEACLLPLNRGAQRRVLSRLVREVRKSAPGTPGHVAPVEVGDVDADFDDLLGETSPPPVAAGAPELPRGIGSEQPRRAAGELPRGVSSSRPADNKASSAVVERAVPVKVDDEVTRHHEVTADERGRARRVRTPVENELVDAADGGGSYAGRTARPERDGASRRTGRDEHSSAGSARVERDGDAHRTGREELSAGGLSRRAGREEHSSAGSARAERDGDAHRTGREERSTAGIRRPDRDGDARRTAREELSSGGSRRRTGREEFSSAGSARSERDGDSPRTAREEYSSGGTLRDGAAGAGEPSRRVGREELSTAGIRRASMGAQLRRPVREDDPNAAALGRARGRSENEVSADAQQHGSARERTGSPDAAERGTARPRSDTARTRPSERPSRGAPGSRSRAPLDLDAMVETNGSRGRLGLWVFLGTTAAAVAMLLGYFALGREQSQSALGFLRPNDGNAAPTKPAPVPRRAYGDLRVNSQPDRAQVLLLLGPGPALATDIPVGVAQEFIAMAEGYRPARALLPADGVWDELNGQPRYELAIQARPFHEGRKPNTPDALGPTLLPQNVGAPTGRLGSVRVVTTPRAAEVYQLIGFTPDVHVDNLPLDHAYELVIYAEGHKTARKHLEPSDFIEQDGKRVARIEVQLPAAD